MHNSECTTSLTKATKYADKRAPVPSVVFVVSFERERNSSVVRIWEHGTTHERATFRALSLPVGSRNLGFIPPHTHTRARAHAHAHMHTHKIYCS